ncbi:hypothetical protein VP424E501_P0063 [Vibrio phage 424E50-1]|nr:hypothetical protein VP424E501_P0063 [Vibrio phage 424E50-1]
MLVCLAFLEKPILYLLLYNSKYLYISIQKGSCICNLNTYSTN